MIIVRISAMPLLMTCASLVQSRRTNIRPKIRPIIENSRWDSDVSTISAMQPAIPHPEMIERTILQRIETGWKIMTLTTSFERRISFVLIGSDLFSQILFPSRETDGGVV